MSKELTEKWRNGTLEESMYYVELPDNDIPIVNLYQLKQLALVNDADEIDILAKVPTYDEWQELQEASDGLSKTMFKSLMDRFVKADEERERLEDRLKEAEEVIKFYSDARQLTEEEKQMTAEKYHLVYGLKANDYLERYDVK